MAFYSTVVSKLYEILFLIENNSPVYTVLQKLVRYRDSLKHRVSILSECKVSSTDGEEGAVPEILGPINSVIENLNVFINHLSNGDLIGYRIQNYCNSLSHNHENVSSSNE